MTDEKSVCKRNTSFVCDNLSKKYDTTDLFLVFYSKQAIINQNSTIVMKKTPQGECAAVEGFRYSLAPKKKTAAAIVFIRCSIEIRHLLKISIPNPVRLIRRIYRLSYFVDVPGFPDRISGTQR